MNKQGTVKLFVIVISGEHEYIHQELYTTNTKKAAQLIENKLVDIFGRDHVFSRLIYDDPEVN